MMSKLRYLVPAARCSHAGDVGEAAPCSESIAGKHRVATAATEGGVRRSRGSHGGVATADVG